MITPTTTSTTAQRPMSDGNIQILMPSITLTPKRNTDEQIYPLGRRDSNITRIEPFSVSLLDFLLTRCSGNR